MSAYEIMLSESQERMLLVLRRGAEAAASAASQMGPRLRDGRSGDRHGRDGAALRRR